MKTALFIVLGYFVASLIATLFSLALQPPHAHVPVLVLVGFFPLLPLAWIAKAFEGTMTLVDGMSLCLFALLMVGSGYLARRAWRKATQ